MRWFMSRNTSPRDDKRSKPKGWIRGNTKIGPVLEVKVTNYLERDGIEVKIGSMQNDGSQSWIVISRGIIKYVTELPEENDKPTTKKWHLVRRNPLPRNNRNNSYHLHLYLLRLLCRSAEME